jgi:hypothetical protein
MLNIFKKRLHKTSFATKASLVFFVFIFLFVQLSVLTSVLSWSSFKDLSFESSNNVIESGNFAEIRQTSDGHIIERLFTGMPEIPFMDYMVVSNNTGEKSYIPLRFDQSILEVFGVMFYENLGIGKDIIISIASQVSYPSLETFLFLIILFQGFFYIRKDLGFLLFRKTAKNKVHTSLTKTKKKCVSFFCMKRFYRFFS